MLSIGDVNVSSIALDPYRQGLADGMYVLSNQQLTKQVTAVEQTVVEVQSQHTQDANYMMHTMNEVECLKLRVTMLEKRLWEFMKAEAGIQHVA